MDHEALARWIDRYERAWRTPGTAVLDELFAPSATYRAAPFAPVISGRAAIGSFWETEREGADEVFSMTWEPVAVENDIGVARVERYGDLPVRVYRDLWIVTLDDRGRCSAFEEWPFFPGQPRTSHDVELEEGIDGLVAVRATQSEPRSAPAEPWEPKRGRRWRRTPSVAARTRPLVDPSRTPMMVANAARLKCLVV